LTHMKSIARRLRLHGPCEPVRRIRDPERSRILTVTVGHHQEERGQPRERTLGKGRNGGRIGDDFTAGDLVPFLLQIFRGTCCAVSSAEPTEDRLWRWASAARKYTRCPKIGRNTSNKQRCQVTRMCCPIRETVDSEVMNVVLQAMTKRPWTQFRGVLRTQ
jgi:hypothetical protein